MKKMEDYGVLKSVMVFVVFIGYMFNLDGVLIYFGIGMLFVV